MNAPAGLLARQAISFGSALILILGNTGLALAQEESPESSRAPTSPPITNVDASFAPQPSAQASIDPPIEPESPTGGEVPAGPLALDPWQNATLEGFEAGYFVRAVASSELGTVALGNREFDGTLIPAAWASQDGQTWQRAGFADGELDGLVEAAVATPDGWVAVGRDIPVHARAWRSADGLSWQNVTDIESAEGHVFYDVATTPLGLIAVGCEVEFHCQVGKAWRSDDGSSWELLSELPIQLPGSVGAVGETVIVAGFSDGFETQLSDGVSASSTDGITWTLAPRVFKGPGGVQDLVAADEEILAVGVKLGARAKDDQTRLYRSGEGQAWARINDPELKGWDGFEVASQGDLVVVAGTLPSSDKILPKVILSNDRADWDEASFADGLLADGYHIFDLTFTHDGSRAVLVGAADLGPAIWYADVVAAPADTGGRTAAIGAPKRFETADVPDFDFGVSVRDVISGGPGYIAVGGGSSTGLDMKALIWLSEDGRTWQPATLEGDAVNGLIEGVSAIPAGGYVAVGRDFGGPGRPDNAPANALVWRSDDGSTWTRVKSHKSFTGSVMYDVTSAAGRVVAVGCKADFHCREGRVWTSSDGTGWQVAETLPMAPFAVAANGGLVAAGGIDDAVTLGAGQAMIAAKGDRGWGVTDSLGKPKSQMNGVAAHGDGFVMAGWQSRPNGGATKAALFVSLDGQTWDLVTNRKFRKVSAADVDASGDLVLVGGTSFDPAVGTTPTVLWTRDLETFKRAAFPKDLDLDGLDLSATAISDDGTLALAAGANGYEPAIWYSELE